MIETIKLFLYAYIVFAFSRLIYQTAIGMLYKRPPATRTSHTPLVSVVIPAWNEERGILKTIDSVKSNTYPNIEIIVVDDGSSDNTAHLVGGVDGVKLIKQPQSGKSAALRNGINASTGEYIMTIDADSYITPNSIYDMASVIGSGYTGVTGEIIVGSRGALSSIQDTEFSMIFHNKRAQHLLGSLYLLSGAFSMYKADILKSHLPPEGSIAEDLDISMSIKRDGYSLAYVDTAVCVTEGAGDMRSLLNQRSRWRHGFFNHFIDNPKSLLSLKKGAYLSFVGLPFTFITIIESLFMPIIAIAVLVLTIHDRSVVLIFLFYITMLSILIAIIDRRTIRKDFKRLALMPLLLVVIAAVEHAAVVQAILRRLGNKKTKWTNWNRKGLE